MEKITMPGGPPRVNQKVVLFHYAMVVWNACHYGSWQLYGHSHGTLTDNPNTRAFDVGVDCNNYRPISFEEVAQRMEKYKHAPVDHHIGHIQ